MAARLFWGSTGPSSSRTAGAMPARSRARSASLSAWSTSTSTLESETRSRAERRSFSGGGRVRAVRSPRGISRGERPSKSWQLPRNGYNNPRHRSRVRPSRPSSPRPGRRELAPFALSAFEARDSRIELLSAGRIEKALERHRRSPGPTRSRGRCRTIGGDERKPGRSRGHPHFAGRATTRRVMFQAYVRGTGAYVPERVLSNNDLEAMVDTSDEWITQRTGIKERRLAAPDETTSALALRAAREALVEAEMRPDELDAIIVATLTPDTMSPAA